MNARRVWAGCALTFCALGASAGWAKPSAVAVKRDADNCRLHANLDACYDAIRWSPRDAALQVSLGDAFKKAGKPTQANKAYRRAAEINPSLPGLGAKLRSVEPKSRLAVKRQMPAPKKARAELQAAANSRFSNTDPVTQSH